VNLLSKLSSKIGRVIAGTVVVAAVSLAVAPAANAMVNCGCRPGADQSMVFVRNASGGPQVFKADQNLSHITQLTTGLLNNEPSINTARTLIAFTGLDASKHRAVFVMNADGSNKRNITNDTSHDYFNPSISPDGTKVVVTSNRGGGSELFVITVSNGAVSQRTVNSGGDGQNWAPAYSPNGQYIAFTSTRGNVQNIWMMPAGGGSAQRVTFDHGDDNAAWSPNGQQIAFTSRANGSVTEVLWADAFSVNVLHQVSTPDGHSHFDPTWSPDGASIAYSSADGPTSIKAAGVNGANQHLLISDGSMPNWGFPIPGPVASQ
jgi:TolB protein